MKIEKLKHFQSDLQNVVARYGITRWALGGSDKSGHFVGIMQDKQTQGACMLTIINVGRLWQYARQVCRGLLDSYERLL